MDGGRRIFMNTVILETVGSQAKTVARYWQNNVKAKKLKNR